VSGFNKPKRMDHNTGCHQLRRFVQRAPVINNSGNIP
jgi:hypothetical protein